MMASCGIFSCCLRSGLAFIFLYLNYIYTYVHVKYEYYVFIYLNSLLYMQLKPLIL